MHEQLSQADPALFLRTRQEHAIQARAVADKKAYAWCVAMRVCYMRQMEAGLRKRAEWGRREKMEREKMLRVARGEASLLEAIKWIYGCYRRRVGRRA